MKAAPFPYCQRSVISRQKESRSGRSYRRAVGFYQIRGRDREIAPTEERSAISSQQPLNEDSKIFPPWGYQGRKTPLIREIRRNTLADKWNSR